MLTCPECGRTFPVEKGFCPMDGTGLMSPAEASEAASDGSARVGQVLERRYRLDEVVGEGGMAHVYRVTHTMIGKSLAAKIVRPELSNDEEVVRRFLREAQIVSSIKHPNVVDVSDFGETPEGGAFCVMELLRGETLADRIDRDGALAPDEALGVALQLCQGLSAAHEAGVVHRDLKPQNVFVCDAKEGKDPVIKLIDFGVARAGRRITVAGAVLGTPEYMAPEQVRGEAIDAGADLYALGVMLFEMLTAMVPFRSDDVARTMQSHLYAEPPAMEVADPSLAHLGRTQAVVSQLMSKARADRPEDAVEASALIQRAIEADLGEEAAARVVRSTVAIGSGGISQEKEGNAPAAAPGAWSDRKMGWGEDAADAADSAEPVDSTPAPVRVIEETVAPAAARPGIPLALVVALSAAVAAVLTGAGYYILLAPTQTTRASVDEAEVLAGPAPRTGNAGPRTPVAVEAAAAPAADAEPTSAKKTIAPVDPGTPQDSEDANRAEPPGTPSATADSKPSAERLPTKRRRRPDAPSGPKAGGKNRPKPPRKAASAPADPPSAAPPAPTEQPPSQSKPAEPKAPDVPPPAGDLKDPFGRK